MVRRIAVPPLLAPRLQCGCCHRKHPNGQGHAKARELPAVSAAATTGACTPSFFDGARTDSTASSRVVNSSVYGRVLKSGIASRKVLGAGRPLIFRSFTLGLRQQIEAPQRVRLLLCKFSEFRQVLCRVAVVTWRQQSHRISGNIDASNPSSTRATLGQWSTFSPVVYQTSNETKRQDIVASIQFSNAICTALHV